MHFVSFAFCCVYILKFLFCLYFGVVFCCVCILEFLYFVLLAFSYFRNMSVLHFVLKILKIKKCKIIKNVKIKSWKSFGTNYDIVEKIKFWKLKMSELKNFEKLKIKSWKSKNVKKLKVAPWKCENPLLEQLKTHIQVMKLEANMNTNGNLLKKTTTKYVVNEPGTNDSVRFPHVSMNLLNMWWVEHSSMVNQWDNAQLLYSRGLQLKKSGSNPFKLQFLGIDAVNCIFFR